MRGLKYPERENNQFLSFFAIVQRFASREDAVFFVDSGEGRELFTEQLEGEDLSGWLIPNAMVDEFESFYKSVDDKLDIYNEEKWDDMFRFAVWSIDNGDVTIKFVLS